MSATDLTMTGKKRTSAFFWYLFSFLIAGAIFAVAFHYSQIAKIGSGYVAKILCSGIFVGKQQAQQVIDEDVRADLAPILAGFSESVDREKQTVTASFFGLFRQTAVYRNNLGCTLALDASVTEIKSHKPAKVTALRPKLEQWPGGGIVNLMEVPNSVDKNQLAQVMAYWFQEPDPEQLRRTRAIVVVHKGKIVAEKYAQGITPKTPLLGWSLTKTVTNALAGILANQGQLSVDRQNLLMAWAQDGDRRAKINIDNLLRMSSGLAFDEEYDMGISDIRRMLFLQGDKSEFAASRPLKASPGTQWEYSSGTTNILTKVLQNAHGSNPTDFLNFPRKALFEPLSMSTAIFEPDAADNLVGSSYMYASARDWARLGLLYLQGGQWNGKTIFSKQWLEYSLQPSQTNKDYGAHIWLRLEPHQLGDKALNPEIPKDAFFMLGHDGQIVAVIPSYDLVVVRFGVSRTKDAWLHGPFLSSVLAAFKNGRSE